MNNFAKNGSGVNAHQMIKQQQLRKSQDEFHNY